MIVDSAPVRFLGSLGLALCVVVALLWLALKLTGFADREQPRALEAHAVEALSAAERRDLADVLGSGPARLDRVPVAPGADTAPFDPAREVRGAVRLDVGVDAAGRVSDVRVIDATPAGIYEAQAIAEIRQHRYEPEVVDGQAMPSRHLEIVDFTIRPAGGGAD